MSKPLICLCLTGSTLMEDVEIVQQYRKHIDLVELRVDFLEDDERLNIRDFPSMIDLPCILTIRRTIDGGKFEEGEATRTMLFARGLAFADTDKSKNFAYVDFEEDFNVPSLQDAALAFGTKIIRSFHDMKNPVRNVAERIAEMRTTGYEIPKIAFMPHSLEDVTNLYKEMQGLENTDQIVCAMGPFGLPTRILAAKFNSYLTYTSPALMLDKLLELGHMDPETLDTLYHFHKIDRDTKIFGITGFPLKVTSSPKLHNTNFEAHGMNAVFVPFKAENAAQAFEFAKTAGVKGFSVTIPHKEEIIKNLVKIDKKVEEIGACNTVVNESADVWSGYNTDCTGFKQAVQEFIKESAGLENLKKKKVAIIGAGGASKAIAYAIKELGGKACVFNRTVTRAKIIADKFGFEYASLTGDSIEKLQKYSDLIVQTTSKGMGATEAPCEENDPLWFYNFTGDELVYDIVYEPEETPIMRHAMAAGCKVCNGFSMLKYQGEEQFRIYKEIYEKA